MSTPWGYRPRNERDTPEWDLHPQTHAVRDPGLKSHPDHSLCIATIR
jgi:hypothetical protein